MMNIYFSDKFNEEAENFEIRRSHVEQVIENPAKTEDLEFDGLSLEFYTRRVSEAKVPHYLWVEGKREEDGGLTVFAAYKIPTDLHPDMESLTPLEMLRLFLERFGLKVRIGDLEDTLIMKKIVPIEPEKPDQIQFKDSGTLGSGSAWVKLEENDGQWVAKSALAYTVNYEDYMDWLKTFGLVIDH